MTRSDINDTADTLLRHEKLVFSLLFTDLINLVKQRAAVRMEGCRISHKELLNTPEFIFEETAHQSDVLRNVLVLDNLEENLYSPTAPPLNLAHLKIVTKTIAKFHAVSLVYKKSMFDSFAVHSDQVAARKNVDDVEIEGENKVLTGRMGLFDRSVQICRSPNFLPFFFPRWCYWDTVFENRSKSLNFFYNICELLRGNFYSNFGAFCQQLTFTKVRPIL